MNTENSQECLANSDEATLAQQDAIESDIRAESPLVSPLLSMTTLKSDFLGHSVYLEKLKFLEEKYYGLRRIRRDGSCFYRAFGFAYIEYLLKSRNLKEAARFKRKCDECRDTLINLGYTRFTVEDFHEQFVTMIDQLISEGGSLAELEQVFNSQSHSDYYVVFLRLLVSAFIQKHADFYANFIDSGGSIKHFCETEVEPMAKDSDHIHVAALALAVGIPIGVENCQQSGELARIDFQATSSAFTVLTDYPAYGEEGQEVKDSQGQPPVVLLYRPGHYEILYARTG